MKHEDFVTYNQAIKLKELGFDWKTHAFYNKEGDLYSSDNPDYWNDEIWNEFSAPTLAQAQHWMLEKFGLWIEITRDTIETKMFNCEINHADDVYREWVGVFDNIFDALSEGIDKAIDILKTN